MPTLELTLQRKTDNGYPVVAALTRSGGFLPLRREGTLSLDIEKLAELQFEPLAYGTALGQALFVNEIRDTFVKALGDEPLRVLLSIEAPDLRALDWHRLAAPFDGRWRCLATQQNTPFSLSVPSPASAHFPAIGRRDLRALLLVAGPESLSGDYKLAPFDVAATIESIKAALGDIPCDVLSVPSLDALCAALTDTNYTILHLVCHGAVNERGETILYFPKDERRTPTPATDLLDRLGSLARLPHFAFISACESALPQNGLGSLAGRLVRELGLPAVLAMTDRVSIATVSAIAAPFYAHLYQHGQPDLALAQSLAGLQGTHDLTVPAIFSRLGDRPLFDDNSERELTDKELEFGLAKLAESLSERAPVMDSLRDSLTRRLRSTLGADAKALSESSRTERTETLSALNSLSLEALDLSFNALCLGQTPPAYDSRSPFRGLESFRVEDKDYFFGREALTKKLVQKLNEHNFLAVLGASGSGKSSLVMAGLIPALNVPYIVFRPGAEPLVELDKALQAGPQLLVIDQFEELFTISAREQRAEFISRLLEQSQRIRVVITLRADFLGEVAPFKSLKDEVQNHQEIIPPMDEAELRRSMEAQAGCAGLRFESDLSQQMLDDVSGEPGAMPLLQHALWTLWTRRHGRWLRADEYRAFGGVKQVIASTAEAVFARCTDFEKERLRDIFLRLTRLDESADGRDTRRRVPLGDLIPSGRDAASITLLLDKLANARLIVKTVNGDKTEIEVAHEALIRHWERLRLWLNENRENLRLRESVSEDSRRWENAGRDESMLNHRGGRLDDALAVGEDARYGSTAVELAYLKGCVAYQKREQNRRERLRRQITTGFGVGFVIMLAVAILAIFQWQRAEQQTQIALAGQLAAQAWTDLSSGTDHDSLVGVLLTAESLKHKLSFNGIQSANQAIKILPKLIFSFDTNDKDNDYKYNYGASLAFDNESQYIMLGDPKLGDIRVWDIYTKKPVIQMQHKDVEWARFSPDNKYVASASPDHIYLWDANTGSKINEIAPVRLDIGVEGRKMNVAINWEDLTENHPGTSSISPVTSLHDYFYVATNSNGSLAVYSNYYEVVVWDVEKNKAVNSFPFHTKDYERARYIAFSAQSNRLVVVTSCANVYVFDIQSGKEVFYIGNDLYISQALAISRTGKFVAYTTEDDVTYIWNVDQKNKVGQIVQDKAIVEVCFSPDEHSIAVLSDNFLTVWKLENFRESIDVTSAEFKTYSTSNNKWEVVKLADSRYSLTSKTNKMLSTILIPSVTDVTFTWDERWVIIGTNENYSQIIDAKSLKNVSSFYYLDDYDLAPIFNNVSPHINIYGDTDKLIVSDKTGKTTIWQMTFDKMLLAASVSQNEEYIIAGGEDKMARVWNIISGEEILRTTHQDNVIAVAFSNDNLWAFSSTGPNVLSINTWDSTFLFNEMCSRVYRNLTRAEWQHYIGDALPYQAVCPNLPIEPEPTVTPTP